MFALALGVFGLVTAEFLPASLLTPIARELGISEALAGQAVTATAVVAFFAGLLAAVVTRGLDRRLVLMGFSTLLIVSNLLVAVAPNLLFLLLARVLLGVALGGFWSMATAVAMRLVPPALVPRALSMVFSGVSIATIVAVPLGSYLGGLYGWRVVFLLAAGIGVVTLLAQAATLPRLANLGSARLGTLVDVLRRPGIGLGMVCVVLVFSGHFGLFTYVRPFLESAGGVNVDGIALTLMAFGLANFAGTLLAGCPAGAQRPPDVGPDAPAHRRRRPGARRAARRSAASGVAGGALGPGLRHDAGGLVDMAGASGARRGRERRWPDRGRRATRHHHRGSRRRRHLRACGRGGRLRHRRRTDAGDLGRCLRCDSRKSLLVEVLPTIARAPIG